MMTLTAFQYLLGLGAGTLVGFSLGLVGGGGSILAVPLMVYVVGIASPHIAIGTSAFAVAGNAAANLIAHARRGNVHWRCAGVFAIAGVLGAAFGSSLGKNVDGQTLLTLFALLMLVVGILMLRHRRHEGRKEVRLDRRNAPKLVLFGLFAGGLSGFFGIGGGFLIVPALMAATGMGILQAIASSLLAIAAFGLTTALNYAWSGWVDWLLAAAFILGGILGGAVGARLATRLSQRRGLLNQVFAALIFVVATYVLYQSTVSVI